MIKTAKINGEDRKVLNTLSSGPGEVPHTLELEGREYVYRVGDNWYRQRPGHHVWSVSVEW